MMRIVSFVLILVLAGSAGAQGDGAPPTRRQREHLQPLITSVARRLELHLPSALFEEIERKVRKALSNQNSDVAIRNYHELLIELLLEDLDLPKADAKTIEFDIVPRFGETIRGWSRELAHLDDEWKLGDHPNLRFSRRGLRWDHYNCVRHRERSLAKLDDWRRKFEADKDQQRGLKELADYYASKVEEAFGVEREDRHFHELFEGALLTRDTDRAMLCALAKVRHLVRPIVWRVHEVEDELQARLDALELVDTRLEKELKEAVWWTRLRQDHEAMLRDPKKLRKELSVRKKDEG